MEDQKAAENPGAEHDATPEQEQEQRKILGLTIPQGVALLIVLGPVVGFLLTMIGTGQDSTTTSVDLVISPQNAGGTLEPGATSEFIVLVPNPNEYGVQVASISAGASKATPGGCPAGTVTSEARSGPPGYIGPEGVRSYSVEATMAADAGDRCQGGSFTLPLTVELISTE